jgi:hypothetical protein
VYVQTVIDNFDDNWFDTTKWEITQGPGTTESGGMLNQSCAASYPRVEGKSYFDLTRGILASKLSISGTRSPNTEFYIGARNSSGNAITAMGAPNGAYLTFQGSGATSFSGLVVSDTSMGLGPGWVNGTWWGIGNMGASDVIRMYKSADGQNWVEMARCTVGGTFDKTQAALVFMAGIWDGTTTDLKSSHEDASYWVEETQTFVTRKVRWGNQWVAATPKVRLSGNWVPAAPKPRIGGGWDPML